MLQPGMPSIPNSFSVVSRGHQGESWPLVHATVEVCRRCPPTALRGTAVPGPASWTSVGCGTVSFLLATSVVKARRTAHCTARRAVGVRARGAVEEAKAKFLTVLKEKGGDCGDSEVVAEIQALAALNPTKDPATTGVFLDADWRQITKSTFPGELRDEVYTLGRLSFNLYKPADMEWKIEQTLNPVRPASDSKDGERDYEFWIDLTCVDPRYPKYKAQMKNFGKCKPNPKKPERLMVWFTGGSLMPAPDMDPALLPQWKETFGAAMGAEKPTLFGRLTNWALKMMMGLERPDSVNDDGSMHYEMTKAPHGYTDILYMDEELRITKGNNGTIVAVDRPPSGRADAA